MEQRLEWLQIDSLDLEARGVGRSENGKVVFVANALPGERVQARIHRSKRNWESGEAVAWASTASSRVTPRFRSLRRLQHAACRSGRAVGVQAAHSRR